MYLGIFVFFLTWHCQRVHGSNILNEPEQPDTELQQKVLQVLQIIHLERQYESILIYGGQPCVFHEVLPQLEVPTVLRSQGSTVQDWNFNTETLLLCCSESAEQEQNNVTLLKLQQARRLVYLEEGQNPEQLCDIYFGREHHNVAMLNTEGCLFSCRCFQDKNFVQLYPDESSFTLIYVEQFANMKGAIIKTELDQWAPRSMLYRDARGNMKMIGYVANLINTFVERVNATLQLSDDYEIGKIIHYTEIDKMARNNQIDLGTVLTSIFLSMDMDYLTYPYLSTSFCIMVPLPKQIPYMDIYTIVVDDLVVYIMAVLFVIFSLMINYSRHLPWKQLGLANILLNDLSLRGLLGQSFPLPSNPSKHLKAICMLLCFSSLMTSTMFGCYLQSLYTHPPLEPSIHCIADFMKSRYKLAIDRRILDEMLKRKFLTQDQTHKVLVVDDLNELLHMRDTFNDSYIYLVTETRFQTYAEQQQIFAKSVFYYATDFCLNRFVPLSIPIRRHLPYRKRFEEHMLDIHEFGLSQFWIERGFYDMVAIDHIPMQDYSSPKWDEEEPIFLEDFSVIFKVYGTANLLAFICFAFECYWGKNYRAQDH